MAEARRITTKDERIEIVQYCLEHDRDYKRTAEKYDVSYSQVYSWVRKHNDRGNDGLNDRRGYHKSNEEVEELEKLSTPETIAENILHREFSAERPNEKWVTNVTEFRIPMSNRKLYLSAILDLYDRCVVSYILSNRNNNKLVLDTYALAL